jgi:hypothetical protein
MQEELKMTEDKSMNEEFKEEFSKFSENLKSAFNQAWASEERQKFQGDITEGINQLGTALTDFVTSFSASETGQKFINEVDEFGERLRSGEVEEKAREGLMTVLQKVNSELKKASDHFSSEEDDNA